MKLRSCAVPEGALLSVYAAQAQSYTDCFEILLPREVALSDLIAAFYTTWLFRAERAVLTLALRRRIADAEVRELAKGSSDRFAVWRVEARRPDQILLCDQGGHTRSFLAVAQAGPGQSRLLFGSAVVSGKGRSPGLVMQLLIPLHRLYARSLLYQAARRLRKA